MSEANAIKFGLDTFGDMSQDDNGNPISAAQTIRNLVEQAKLADLAARQEALKALQEKEQTAVNEYLESVRSEQAQRNPALKDFENRLEEK